MPTVGSGKRKKEFEYTPAGEKAAQAYAKKTGQKVTRREGADKKGKGK